MIDAQIFIDTIFKLVDSTWSLVQEYDRLGFKDGIALLDPNGKQIAIFEQTAYDEIDN